MLQSWYPFFLGGIILAIVWWFYSVYRNPDSRTVFPSLTFWGSTLMYALSVYSADYSFWYKLLLMLPRDAVLLLSVFLVANNLKSSRGFFVSAMSVGLLGTMLFSGLSHRAYDYFFRPEVDKAAEILFESDDIQVATIKKNLARYDIKIKKAFPDIKNKNYANLDNYYVADISEEQSKDMILISNIMYATGANVSFNCIVKLSPLSPSQPTSSQPGAKDYSINDPALDKLWGFEKMQMEAFYKYLKAENIKPKKKIKLAILDTGVDAEHEDLKAKFVSTNPKHNTDKQSHGTHCAGIAASVSDNGKGIASFSPDNRFAEVTSIKVLSDEGYGTDRDIMAGIIEAADNGASVISMSLGGPSTEGRRRGYAEAVKYAQKSGAIVIVAAGNESTNAKNVTPANVEGVITVSAIDENLDMASFSNFVSDIKMGIAAPGVNIYSTVPGNKYAAYSGTSMATPYVAGLVAMMKSLQPDLSTEQVYQLLKSTGTDTKNTEKTGKFIQPLEVLKALKR